MGKMSSDEIDNLLRSKGIDEKTIAAVREMREQNLKLKIALKQEKEEALILYDELFEEPDDGMGETCSACGNPAYPDCMSTCDLLDY